MPKNYKLQPQKSRKSQRFKEICPKQGNDTKLNIPKQFHNNHHKNTSITT